MTYTDKQSTKCYTSSCISLAMPSFRRLDSQLVEEGVLPDQFHIVPVLTIDRAQRRRFQDPGWDWKQELGKS